MGRIFKPLHVRIRILQAEQGISNLVLCKELEIPIPSFSSWKNGKKKLAEKHVEKLKLYFNIK